MSARLTDEQLAALKDAHRSINEGGLIEMPSQNPLDQCWTAMNPDFKKRHAQSTIERLSKMQLVRRTDGQAQLLLQMLKLSLPNPIDHKPKKPSML